MEEHLDGLCDRLTVVCKLEERQLQLGSHHCRPIVQDGILQTSQSHY